MMEFQRAKRASPRGYGTFDKTIKIKKFTVRASERASVCIDPEEGEVSLNFESHRLENVIFSYQDLRKKIASADYMNKG